MILSVLFLSGLTATLGGLASHPGFETVGLYVWKDSPDQHAFWKACGINTLQFCDTHWSIREDLLDDYYQRFADGVANAARSGFRTDIILFSNISQWRGPAEREPSGTGVLFAPRDRAAFDARMASLARAVRSLRRADGFTFIAGDPGGAVRAPFGPLAAAEWIDMAREVRMLVKREAPRATFSVNPWAIAYWEYPNLSCWTSAWWIREDILTRDVLDAPDLIGPDCGVQIAGHQYYRPLALRTVAQDSLTTIDPFPRAEHVLRLRDRGTRHVWAWPYFLLDEADDGDVGPDGRRKPAIQMSVRYVHRLVRRMREIGMNGIVGNWSYAGYLPGAVNTYAFGRFAGDARTTPERVIDEYARCLADDGSWQALAQALRFVENHSGWERKLPASHRLPALRCEFGAAEEALKAVDQAVPRAKPRFALPEPAADQIERLRVRLRGLSGG